MHVHESAPAPGAGLKTLTVLVADDDADMRLYVMGCLRGFGLTSLTLTEATNGRDALVVARAVLPDLIISDVVMPVLDGFSLFRALKSDPATSGIPILLISGETRDPPANADGFLEKPFNASQLRVPVMRLLGRPP